MITIIKNHSILSHHTFGIDQSVSHFLQLESKADLDEFLTLKNTPPFESLPIIILGEGSNSIFLNDIEALVVRVNFKTMKLLKADQNFVYLQVGAGENWDDLVAYSVQNGWQGLENLSLIPGTVGAAPIQNIGAYGVELADVFEQAEALSLETGETHIFTKSDCQFSYRNSFFKRQKGKWLIWKITLKLRKKPILNLTYGNLKTHLHEQKISQPNLQDLRNLIIKIRRSKLPDYRVLGNSGSFFQNPIIDLTVYKALKNEYPDLPAYILNDKQVKIPAGWLIERAGWKGYKYGQVGVYHKQALILVNLGKAKSYELLELVEVIQTDILRKFGLSLKPEVNLYH